MAVFTKVSERQLTEFLRSFFQDFHIIRFEGIAAGIENTNYFLDINSDSQRTQWVLTLFEMADAESLSLVVRLTQFLSSRQLPVPAPVSSLSGRSVQSLAGKPCVLVPRVAGRHIVLATVAECRQIGEFLGEMHVTTTALNIKKPTDRHVAWLQQCQARLLCDGAGLSGGDRTILAKAISRFKQLATTFEACPVGWTHGDLFIDNALFADDELTGIIDFYHACEDYLIIDVAIACNDWCYWNGTGYQSALMSALIDGYQQRRPLLQAEKQLWSDALGYAALRFWVSRLISKYTQTYQSAAVRGHVYKNPDEMKQKLVEAAGILPLK